MDWQSCGSVGGRLVLMADIGSLGFSRQAEQGADQVRGGSLSVYNMDMFIRIRLLSS